jgi:methylated-DNA-[protein]-cysteine S-methyltransferase
VWQKLQLIEYGTTTTYGALAYELGTPKASRAVGLANGSNPIPIVIPCHRVIGANGALTGFGGGLPVKSALLELERSRIQRSLF